jgi:hypothetical protein
MPRFDPETIAALAEGRLSPDEAARVEAAIANDPAALADLEMQRSAIAALSSAPEIQLTELERSGMRASVADALGLVPLATPIATDAPRRVPWGSLGIAAAALLGLIAVVPVVGLLNTAGGDSAETALAPAATNTDRFGSLDAPSPTADLGTDETSSPADDGSFDPEQEAPGEELLGFGSSTTLASRAADTTLDPASESTTTEPASEGDSTSTTATIESAVDGDIERLLSDLTALQDDPVAVGAIATEALEDDLCWPEDTEYRGGEDPGDRWSFEFPDDTPLVVVYFRYDEEGTPGPFTVYEWATCTSVAEIPESP